MGSFQNFIVEEKVEQRGIFSLVSSYHKWEGSGVEDFLHSFIKNLSHQNENTDTFLDSANKREFMSLRLINKCVVLSCYSTP